MMAKNVNPCYKCENRAEACHSHCELYKLWKMEQDALNEVRLKEKRTRHDSNAVTSDRVEWLRKRKGCKGSKQR